MSWEDVLKIWGTKEMSNRQMDRQDAAWGADPFQEFNTKHLKPAVNAATDTGEGMFIRIPETAMNDYKNLKQNLGGKNSMQQKLEQAIGKKIKMLADDEDGKGFVGIMY